MTLKLHKTALNGHISPLAGESSWWR